MPSFPPFKIISYEGLWNANVCTVKKIAPPSFHTVCQMVAFGIYWKSLPLFIREKLICLLLFKKGFVSHLNMGITEPLAKGQNISVPTLIIVHELIE